MNIKLLLPASIISKAYEFNSEYAWRPEDIAELASILRGKRIAVLGGEVWEKTDNGPTISPNIYQWSYKKKDDNESWNDYVDQTLKELIKFTENIQKEKLSNKDIYINVEMANQDDVKFLAQKNG
ncbi:MAG TPA: Imm40 family immunity protein [Candidatus Paceibacterota bacterium]|nr:Imm40 family immunity protein [Candidatus Paceibacterota bacterium]